MTRENTFNFSAGPSMLPTEALKIAASEMLDFRSSGMSVMEMSHRSKVFVDIFNETKANLKEILKVPDTHEILFLQGGASTQFSMVPMNIIGENGKADYCVTGSFSSIAAKEAKKYGSINIAFDSSDCNHTRIPRQDELNLDPGASYFYYCANNTIYGTEWDYIPETGSVPIVCDMSSDILSKPVDVSKYGIIFAGAQKNMGPAGVTVVIIDKALLGKKLPYTPLMLDYAIMVDKDSMYNTPPCYSIYMLGLVLKWIKANGGVEGMEVLKKKRSAMLYDLIDASSIFSCPAQPGSRSEMNICFRAEDDEINKRFIKEATAAGFENIGGHRSVGGMRASCYNAMPMEGVEKLCDFIRNFEKNI